jgi:ribonuclease P protein component
MLPPETTLPGKFLESKNAECFKFPRRERLKKRSAISAVFRKGKKVAGNGAVLFYRANKLGINRIAFTFAKKFGCAVERNRARRLGRESYRYLRSSLALGYDLVLLVYPLECLDFSASFHRLKRLLDRARLWRKGFLPASAV